MTDLHAVTDEDPMPRHARYRGWLGSVALPLASLLGGLWLGELVGGDRSDYVEIAVALAGDPARLSQMRAGLRERMRGSRLCSAPAFARTIEAAYRALWRR